MKKTGALVGGGMTMERYLQHIRQIGVTLIMAIMLLAMSLASASSIYAQSAAPRTRQPSMPTGGSATAASRTRVSPSLPPTVAIKSQPVAKPTSKARSHSSLNTPAPGAVLWSYRTFGAYRESPVVANSVAYVFDFSTMYALDTENGGLVWSYQVTNNVGFYGAPVVANGTVYAALTDSAGDIGYLYALDAANGTVLWTWNFPSGDSPTDTSLTVANGMVYVGSVSGFVFSVDGASGVLAWSYHADSMIDHSPTVVNGIAYVSSIGGHVYALNAASGALLWNDQAVTNDTGSPIVVNGVVYVNWSSGTHALNASNGAILWTYPGQVGSASSLIVNSGVAYGALSGSSSNIYALDAGSGGLLWSDPMQDGSSSSLTVGSGVVYEGAGDDSIYALNAVSGAPLWSFHSGFTNNCTCYPGAVVNGVLYISSDDGYTYAFNALSGMLLWSFNAQDSFLSSPVVVNNVVYANSYSTTYAIAGSPSAQPPAQGPTNSERQGGNPSELLYCYQCAGDPIDTYSGNFSHTFAGLSIPGRGIPLNFSLTYNASAGAAAQNGPIGYGWTDSYNWSLSTDGSGNVTISQENGSTVSFAPNGSGAYTPPSRVLATLAKNGDGTYTFTRQQSQDRYIFNASGKLIKEIDRNNYTTSLAYNGSGQLTTVTDPAGRALAFTYDGSGRISTVTDPGNRHVSFTYDGSGNLQSYTDVAGGVTSLTYDGSHRLLTMTDPRGGVVTNVYDSSNRVTSQTDALNRTTTFSYTGPDGNGNSSTTITDPKGNVTVDQYYNGLLLAETKGSGTAQAATTSYTYDPVSLGVASITDPNVATTSQTWDANGNLLSTTDPLGRATSYTYDAQNDLLTTTDANGVTTTNTYDAHGNLLTTSTPLLGASQSRTITYAYGDSSHPGDRTALTDPNGKTWKFSYDSYGDRATSTDPLGDVTSDAYNILGQRTSETNARGEKTTMTYDAFGDVTAVTDPLNHTTSYQYDANRNQTQVTDPDGNVTQNTYDLDNELTHVIRADGTTLNYSYDNDGNQTGQTDGLGHTTAYAYDPLNRLVSLSDPLNRTTSYTYDAASNRISRTAPGNLKTTYNYDTANELVGISYSDGSTPGVAYTYDNDGRRASMSDGTGTTTYTYDSLGRLTNVKDGAGNTVGYGYDLTGNLTSLLYPNGKTVTRAYDAAGRMTSVTDWLGSSTTFGYDAVGNLTTITYGNGVRNTRGYDAASQLISIADRYAGATIRNAPQQIFAETYTRDAAGQLLSTTDIAPTQNTTTNSYTGLLQIQSAGSTAYAYDKADEPTQLGTAALTEDAAGEVTQMVAGATTTTFSYDVRGNRTKMVVSGSGGATATYTYDAANRLTSVAGIASGTTTYAYNGDGLRMSKKVGVSATESFVWDTVEGLPLLLVDGATSLVSGPGGMPLEQITGSGSSAQALYLLTDQLGSVRALTDSNGQVVATYTYDAYGATTATTGTAITPLHFAGQYLDVETGLYYLRARYYDSTTAQFLTRDPLVPLTKQPYVYANDNPLNRIDPSGLAPNGSSCLGSAQSCGPLPFLTPTSCLGTGANCYPIACYPNGLPQGPQSDFDRRTEAFFKQWLKDEYTNVIQVILFFYFPEGEYLIPDSVPFTVPGSPGSQQGPSQIA